MNQIIRWTCSSQPALLVLVLIFASCARKPAVCYNGPTVFETGREYELTSCSEHYEFITWNFGDGTYGAVDDAPTRAFFQPGDYVMEITAYAKGAYKSDAMSVDYRVSDRYIDRFEVVGQSSFKRFEFGFGNKRWIAGSASGTFTEDSPYSYTLWPDSAIVIPLERTAVRLGGSNQSSGAGFTTLINESPNFKGRPENPIILEGSGYTLKLFWTYEE